MARKQSSAFLFVWMLLGIIGLCGLLIYQKKSDPKKTIESVLSSYGIGEQTIKYWIAVSAFETSGWTSQVYKDANNLFGVIEPGSNRLPYGEGQTIYITLTDSARSLYTAVIKPLGYAPNYNTIADLVTVMSVKKYFTGQYQDYLAGVTTWYNKLYPNG